MAYIHKFALWINHHTETFWRKHYKLKRFIRGLYYTINEKKNDGSNKEETEIISNLEKMYVKSNDRLSSIL